MRFSHTVKSTLGYSLIELIVVIVLIGVLAVYVGSRFSGNQGFAEHGFQSRVIAVLRTMQTRAMHDTRPGYCFQVNFTRSPSAFGPPTMSYNSSTGTDTCNTTIDPLNPAHLISIGNEMSGKDVAFSAIKDGADTISTIGFDNLGRPLTSGSHCAAGCQIDITGESTQSICIASQGYVYAC